MIFELCPTLSRDLIKREFLNTAAAFGVLVLLGFAAGMIFPDMAQQTLQNFAAQVEQLGLTDDVPQSQMMATLFFNNITASLLSMLYGLIPFLPLSALALGTNALMLGAFAAIYQQQGIGLGVQQARTVALFYCLLAFSHSIAAVCRGAGRAVVPMMIMLSVWCVIRIIYIMLVVRFIGEIGYIYWAYPLTWAISSTIYLIYYLRSDWVHGFER